MKWTPDPPTSISLVLGAQAWATPPSSIWLSTSCDDRSQFLLCPCLIYEGKTHWPSFHSPSSDTVRRNDRPSQRNEVTNYLGLTLKVSYPETLHSPWQIKHSDTYGTLLHWKVVNYLEPNPCFSMKYLKGLGMTWHGDNPNANSWDKTGFILSGELVTWH